MRKQDSVWLVRFSFVFAIFFTFTAVAQQFRDGETDSEITGDEVLAALDLIPEMLEGPIDSRVSSFLLKDRFELLQNEIPLRYNEHSHKYVDFFVDKRASFTRRMLETKDMYFPIFEKTLQKYQLPDELKYLPLIESGLSPRIISRAGAGGLWQFMRATGREFGLQQNQYIDERFHPEKSTDAACRYLKQLHSIFGDWEMALAAYNCGPGNIRRAIRRTGRNDFWGIYPALPKETRNYVPQFVAMTYLMHYSDDHGIVPGQLKLNHIADTLEVNGYLNLRTFAALGGLSLDDIYEHNPHLVGTYLPSSTQSFNLVVPTTTTALLSDNLVAVLDSSAKVPAGSMTYLANSKTTVKDGYEIVTTDVRHTVRSGQTLSSIARQHGVTIAQLRNWNGIQGSMLRKGQRLVVKKTVRRAIPEQQTQQAPAVIAAVKDTSATKHQNKLAAALADDSGEETETAEEVTARQPEGNPVASQSAPGTVMTEEMLLARQAERLQGQSSPEPRTRSNPDTRNIYHVVQAGDTLWAISRKYGLSVDQLKKVNKIKGNALKTGMKILISG